MQTQSSISPLSVTQERRGGHTKPAALRVWAMWSTTRTNARLHRFVRMTAFSHATAQPTRLKSRTYRTATEKRACSGLMAAISTVRSADGAERLSRQKSTGRNVTEAFGVTAVTVGGWITCGSRRKAGEELISPRDNAEHSAPRLGTHNDQSTI